MTKLLVLGIGNLLLTDDGVGVHAAQKLMQEELPSNVEVIEAGTFTHDIFYLFENYTHILVLDIVHAQGQVGDIYDLSESDLYDNKKQRLSIHDIDLMDSLKMAELLYKNKPNLSILGIEPYDYLTWSMELSEPIAKVFPSYLSKVRIKIQELASL